MTSALSRVSSDSGANLSTQAGALVPGRIIQAYDRHCKRKATNLLPFPVTLRASQPVLVRLRSVRRTRKLLTAAAPALTRVDLPIAIQTVAISSASHRARDQRIYASTE